MKIKMNNETYGVYTQLNFNGNKPPHKNCKIRGIFEKVEGEIVVFSGTLAECEKYLKDNCKKKE